MRNCASRAAPSTTSGVDIGRKISRFVDARPRNRNRTSAIATSVPSAVAISVETTPTCSELANASHTCGAPQGFCQFSSVKPCHTRLVLPASLNENTTV